ncbi:ATPase [Oleiphilus messinensis]|uniref:ATPase n=1 Tax=Oleiphilus messinensis TaxID=141451 RepID=A0A1Y0IIG9_9GAMM|nr:ATP-binding protein [Oleiphilus messinensis]ARU59315.1 ATPase [Oleiphilus messinensis]
MIDFIPVKTEWVVLTGPPSSGKTTVLEELKRLGYLTSPDVSREVIKNHITKGGDAVSARKDQFKLQVEILDKMLKVESSLDAGQRVFLDYAIPDNIAYCEMEDVVIPDLEKSSKKFEYRKVFLFEPLPMVVDDVRIESESYQHEIFKKILRSYKKLGYKVRIIKIDSVKNRIKKIILHADSEGKWLEKAKDKQDIKNGFT